jgi:hypothetical protein
LLIPVRKLRLHLHLVVQWVAGTPAGRKPELGGRLRRRSLIGFDRDVVAGTKIKFASPRTRRDGGLIVGTEMNVDDDIVGVEDVKDEEEHLERSTSPSNVDDRRPEKRWNEEDGSRDQSGPTEGVETQRKSQAR